MDGAQAAVLSELDGIFKLKEFLKNDTEGFSPTTPDWSKAKHAARTSVQILLSLM